MAVLFVSDLHLESSRPDLTALFVDFMRRWAPRSEALYILGDLFEVWVGDDNKNADYRSIVRELRELTDTGVPVYVMHGNRDFLLGSEFATASGCTLLPDPAVIELQGLRTLLSHGDGLCTDDSAHMSFRTRVRSADWQRGFLAKPLALRTVMARGARALSNTSKRYKPEDIQDVNQQSVEKAMRQHGAQRLIHGHTHRPAIHDFSLDGEAAQRIVLGDWDDAVGSVLVCDERGCALQRYTGSELARIPHAVPG